MIYIGEVAINTSLFSERLCSGIIVLKFEMFRPFFNGHDGVLVEKKDRLLLIEVCNQRERCQVTNSEE